MPDILNQFKALKLHGMAECYAELQAQGQAGTSEDIGSTAWVLRQLLAAEATDRSIRAISWMRRASGLPFMGTESSRFHFTNSLPFR